MERFKSEILGNVVPDRVWGQGDRAVDEDHLLGRTLPAGCTWPILLHCFILGTWHRTSNIAVNEEEAVTPGSALDRWNTFIDGSAGFRHMLIILPQSALALAAEVAFHDVKPFPNLDLSVGP